MASKRIVIQEDKLPGAFLEACQLIKKMRHYRRRFEQNHDAQTKTQMKDWEARADKFINGLELEDDDQNPQQ